jgi:hypothetical protein
MLPDPLLHKLHSKGILTFNYTTYVLLLKKPEAGGNALPGGSQTKITRIGNSVGDNAGFMSDCPTLAFEAENNMFWIKCINWVPGPGPGDFELPFHTPEKAVKYALSYFFDKNPHFDALLSWHLTHP